MPKLGNYMIKKKQCESIKQNRCFNKIKDKYEMYLNDGVQMNDDVIRESRLNKPI